MENEQNFFEKFSPDAKKTLLFAEAEAKAERIGYIGTEHLFMGILAQEEALGAQILKSFGVTLDLVRSILQESSSKRIPKTDVTTVELSGFAKKTIEEAVATAYKFQHAFVGTEHILYALVSQEGTAAVVILENLKVNPKDIREKLEELFTQSEEYRKNISTLFQPLERMLNNLNGVLFAMGKDATYPNTNMNKEPMQPQMPGSSEQTPKQSNSKTPALDYFTTDLTLEARKKKLDPVIGRKEEIERMMSILNRKTKNNPVLIGEPGVGKTAVVEGLAQAIVNEEVPPMLYDRRILALDMTSLIAGTKYRGEFEARIKQVLDEVIASEENIILFIDELHTVIGAGSAEGSLDAANIMKPILGRGKIQVIGATTIKEYRKHIETDHAFERRFQPIMVEEPDEEVATQILSGLKESFEEHHSLLIDDAAIDEAVKLSKRYINDRYLPDKAIDILDEACSLKGLKRKGTDTASHKKVRAELEKVIRDKERAVAEQKYTKAGELRDKELKLVEDLQKFKIKKSIPRSKRVSVTAEDIAQVISNATRIPVTKLIKSEIASLVKLEETLQKRVIGQEEAVTQIARAVRRSRVGIANKHRPIGSFIFMGPTGVGKTELVKALAKEVFNDETALLKFDMSEMMERHNVSRLIGTTAGYVGYEEGGQLTEMVRKKPYAVVLFDEIEKAHPDVFNLLLQILEDGYLTDGKGRRINFRNTIIVMTSNIGAEQFTQKAAKIGFDFSDEQIKHEEEKYQEVKTEVMKRLQDTFKPELLNRIDATVVFKPLTHDSILRIVRLEISYLEKRLVERALQLDLSDEALEYLAKESFHPEYGARPVRRTIQKLLEDPLTDMILSGALVDGDTLNIVMKKKKLVLEKAKKRKA
jgi:ATP-dependent Clp protease ATP-binding subunit ClpC